MAMADTNRQILVQARGLGKNYPKVFRRGDRLRALYALLTGRASLDVTSVLRNIDLEVRAGQSLGLIGENGAGKSTLLKLLTGVLTPSAGEVHVHGRVGALLELGAGFHPEYSGRDNIAMSTALHGLTVDAARAKLPEIIEFADIGHYIDEPVKHYSSGMVVRLGFAIIAALKPELLITDEVLAVGDEAFQKKCVRWIEDYLEGGGTLILVSHSMYHVQKLCRSACWLRHGEVVASGDVYTVTQAYLSYQEGKTAPQALSRAAVANQGQEFYLIDLSLNGQTADVPSLLDFGSVLRVRVRIHSRDGRVPVAGFGIARGDGTAIYGTTTEMEQTTPCRDSENVYSVQIEFADLSLLPGSYLLRVHALDTEGVRLFDTLERGLTISGQSREFGMVRLAHSWTVPAEIESKVTEAVQ